MTSANIATIRAIGSEFLGHKISAVIRLFLIIGFVAITGTLLLAWRFSAWWLLLLLPSMFIFLVPLLLWVVNKLVVYRLKPKMNKRQITLLRNFVDKLERVAEHAQTPVFIIVFRVARDVLFPREPNYIQSVTSESTTLKPDFIALQKSFEK